MRTVQRQAKAAWDRWTLSLDNLKITEDKDAVAIMLEKTELYLGESSKIIGANLDDVEITCDNEDVITIDREGMKLNAVGAGTAVITAKLPDGDKNIYNERY